VQFSHNPLDLFVSETIRLQNDAGWISLERNLREHVNLKSWQDRHDTPLSPSLPPAVRKISSYDRNL